MIKKFASILIIMAAVAAARGQTASAVFRQVTDALAAAAPESPAQPPDDYFIKSADDPAGKMQRATLLYAAAGRARELLNPGRAPVLAAASKTWLQGALPGLGSKPQAASQCHYYLGMIAEHYEGNLAGARAAFEQALAANPGNARAAQALARVRFVLNQSAGQ